MRTIIIAIGAILLLAVASSFLLLPRQETVEAAALIRAPWASVKRSLSQRAHWEKWWPHAATGLQYREQNFSPDPLTDLLVRVPVQDSALSSLLLPVGVADDSTFVTWTAFLSPTANPLQRVSNRMEARRLKREFQQVLSRLKNFAEQPENIYGFSVKEVKVKTPYLVSLKDSSKSYPSTEAVYALVERLRAYIKTAGARETGAPMLNVGTYDSTEWGFMVALPVDRPLPDKGAIQQKRMVLGKILKAEIRGGDYTVRQSMTALEDYVRDYGRRSPAIPFASLTTNRTKERDTTKWITHLYYPVF
jgi:hypothetical protein